MYASAWFRSEFPSLGHEHTEMVVVVNGGGNSGVVIVPLACGDLSIVVLVSEVGKELKECLILGDFSRNNLWVSVT